MVSQGDIVVVADDSNPYGKLAIVVAVPLSTPDSNGKQWVTLANPDNGVQFVQDYATVISKVTPVAP